MWKLLAASFDGLRPLLVACHCQPFCSLANKLRSFVRAAKLQYILYNHSSSNGHYWRENHCRPFLPKLFLLLCPVLSYSALSWGHRESEGHSKKISDSLRRNLCPLLKCFRRHCEPVLRTMIDTKLGFTDLRPVMCVSTANFNCWYLRWFVIFTRTWLVFAVANPSVVCNVRAPYSGGWNFQQYFSPFCTLVILWPQCKILRRSSRKNPSVGGVKHKRSSKMWRFGYFIWWVFRYEF